MGVVPECIKAEMPLCSACQPFVPLPMQVQIKHQWNATLNNMQGPHQYHKLCVRPGCWKVLPECLLCRETVWLRIPCR